ncbi:MAG: hypothetical protein KDD84_19530, partial [Caldilineaceae bacterium]|nr:hypothetical protein [Caldilineaceae bacterium]
PEIRVPLSLLRVPSWINKILKSPYRTKQVHAVALKVATAFPLAVQATRFAGEIGVPGEGFAA